MKFPRRGEVYLVNLDPTVGVEIKKTRPALIIQSDIYNKYSPITIIAPITSTVKKLGPSKVLIRPPEGGLAEESVVLLNQLRAIDKRRLIRKLGAIESQTITKVNQALMVCLDLILE